MITIDTHIINWDALIPEMLSETAEQEISKANNSDGIPVPHHRSNIRDLWLSRCIGFFEPL